MVEQSARLDRLFHALADGTRRRMLHSLRSRARSVGELAAPFAISLAAASKHIKVLEQAGLVERRIQGRTHLCALRADALRDAQAWLQHYKAFWEQRLDALEPALRTEDPTPASPHPRRKPTKAAKP